MSDRSTAETLTRRGFLRTTAAGTAAGLLASRHGLSAENTEAISFGLVTDVHYADAPAGGTRHYRDSMAKLRQAVETFNRRKVAFLVELGDLVDAGPSKQAELLHLQAIDQVFKGFSGPRHYVLGNHCLNALGKREFLDNCGSSVKKSYYCFDCGGFHFVVLDANFKRDGSPYEAGNFTWTDTWIPASELEWLADDLRQAKHKKAFLFLHQNLHDENDAHGVKNAPEVRRILEASGNVAAVFQGHMHTGGHGKIGKIHYCTLKAMVEGPSLKNNSYATVTIDKSERVQLQGFGRQADLEFSL